MRTGLALALALFLPASSAAAQSVAGRVLDEATGSGVAGAKVVAVNSAGHPAAAVLTDDAGAFVLATAAVGRFRLRVERLGYATVLSPEIDLLRRDTVRVELRIAVDAVVLDPLTVTSDRPPRVLDVRLERRGFYARQDLYGDKMGFAEFMDAEAIRKRAPFRTTDLFQQARGLQLVSLGGRRVDVRALRDELCRPDYYVDGTKLPLLRDETIDDYVIPSSIAAIEIYAGAVYPAEYPRGKCGSIVLWTGYAEGKDPRGRD